LNHHTTKWLAAYFDGELHGLQLQKVEEHLQSCSACRLELEQLRGLSGLLKDCPPMTSLLSPDQFTAQIRLRLPRSTQARTSSTWQRLVNIGWLAIPINLILGWAFSQTTLLIITGIEGLGMDLSGISWLSSLVRWFDGYFFWNLIDSDLWDPLINASPWLDWGEKLAHTFATYLVITVVTAVFLWCWMICWWVLHQRQQQQIPRVTPP
jgi:hypothetical protein